MYHQTLSVVAAPDAQPAPGEVLPRDLAHWELLRVLGEGQLARVYQARPLQGATKLAHYAVKVLREEWQDDDRVVKLMRREAQVGREISNPHLISILDAGLQQPPYYVTMPCLVGYTLADRLAIRRPIPVGEALWIARQTAEAMDSLYHAGWIHGDIKPANIFIAPDGHVTLLDLGFAREVDEGECSLTRPILGTLCYLAPETFISTRTPDIRSDIYSLGATFFQMLAGRPPFASEEQAELVEHHLRRPAMDLRIQHPRLSTAVAQLVWQMLAKSPLRRPQSPRDVVRRLMALEIEELPHRISA